jgi:hypothetical protein
MSVSEPKRTEKIPKISLQNSSAYDRLTLSLIPMKTFDESLPAAP